MEKRFVSIWLPYLAVNWFELRQPQLNNIAFVLVAPSHGRMIITAANVLSEKKGIKKGTVLADARALYPTLKYFDDKPNLENQLLQKIAEWCIRFTPSAAVDPLGGIILDATGCSHLWGGEEAYVNDIIKRLKTKGYYAKAAMADTIGCAWALARYGREKITEPGKQIEALLPLPPEALRLEAQTSDRLYKLGLRQIKSFISMPQSSLKRRFGPLIIQRMNQATGKEEEFIQPLLQAEPYQERLPCLEPISGITGIEIALEKLLQQVCRRLQNEGKGLRTAHFRGYRVDSKIVGIEISTSRASNNVDHLFHLFQMKISTLEPGLGIELFLLEATTIEEHTPVQEEFWKQSSSLNNNSLAELIDRVSQKLGPGSIHRYLPDEHYWPERSFKKASSLNEQTNTDWKIERPRPLRLLPIPEQIQVTAPIPDYPPMLFQHKNKLYKIINADGPERIEKEWWIEDGEHRDYYAVEDEEGGRYWIFRSGHYDAENKPKWYLHGFFP